MGTIDNLTFTYNTGTNRLQKIVDATSIAAAKAQGFNPGSASGTATYGYDANGNMSSDPYKNMTLAHNHLNLPISMNFGSAGTISILYDQVGKKLSKTVTPGTGTGYTQDYVDGLEYRTNGGGGTLTLEAIYYAEGRITPNGANYQYEYNIQDHLGNTRITFADLNANSVVDVPGDILQENHYYPFGMRMNYTWMDNAALDNRYQYNGKEFNDDLGLNLNDYGARWYDAAVGRWWSVDPLSTKYVQWSGYNFALNNPLIHVDLDGMAVNTVTPVDDASQKAYDELKQAYKDAGSTRYDDLIRMEETTEVNYVIDINAKDLGGNDATTRYQPGGTEKEVTINVLVGENINNSEITGNEAKDKRVALADELEHGRQFLDGELGYKIDTKGASQTLGYDQTDELKSQQASIDASNALGVPLNPLQEEFVGRTSDQTFIDTYYSGLSTRTTARAADGGANNEKLSGYIKNGLVNEFAHRSNGKNNVIKE